MTTDGNSLCSDAVPSGSVTATSGAVLVPSGAVTVPSYAPLPPSAAPSYVAGRRLAVLDDPPATDGALCLHVLQQ